MTFHCDAVQGVGLIPLPKADAMTMAAHKFYGPKGIAALIVRDHVELAAQILGGGQEFGLRAGTEYTAGIVGMSTALQLAQQRLPNESKRLQQLRDALVEGIAEFADIQLQGHPEQRLPNFANIQFIGKQAENILMQLDMKGICASSGAACASGSVKSSHVLEAMGRTKAESKQSIRFSLGKNTSEEDIQTILQHLRVLLT